MQFVDRYILAYAITILLTGLMLMALGIGSIEGYYVAYLMEFFAFYEIWARRRGTLEHRLRPIGLVFTVGFLLVIAERVLVSLL